MTKSTQPMRILNGEFSDGHQIRKETIADEYEVSRMPVREALRCLEAEGLVHFHPNRGAVVTELSIADISEMFDLRLMIELDALAFAIPKMTAADLERARGILVLLAAAYETGDVAKWGECNTLFHMALCKPSGRSQSLTFIRYVNSQIERYLRFLLALPNALDRVYKTYQGSMTTIQIGEGRSAGLEMTYKF